MRHNFRESLNPLERLSILRPSTLEGTCPCGHQTPAGQPSLTYVRPDGRWESVCKGGTCVDAFMHSDDHFTDHRIRERSNSTKENAS